MQDDYDLDEDDNPWLSFDGHSRNYEKLVQKNLSAINEFLGDGPRFVDIYESDPYYGSLLVWSLKKFLTVQPYRVIATYAYSKKEPLYRDVPIDYKKSESCMIDGQILVQNGEVRLLITVNLVFTDAKYIQVEVSEQYTEQAKKFLEDIGTFLKDNNFYRGKRICLTHQIAFQTVSPRSWDSIVLDPVMKQEIRMNTTGFLKHREQLIQYGLPQKRGIILAGEPGNGKTIICRALMSEADGITCISSDPYAMCQESYISDLFAIARDLSPSLVFLEDLDFIGQGRDDHFRGETALVALLASMDDIGENQAIVTVGTTNRIEAMDRALSERPSRFDRVFKIERPDGVQRLELLQHMAQKIPLTQDVMEYLVSKTAGFSAAQLQEVSFGMVIARVNAGAQNMEIKCADVDSVIPLINMHKTGRLGFNAGRHNN